jgi:hypothetical protein
LRRNCLLKHILKGKIEGELEVTGRQGEEVSCCCMKFRERKVVGN